jgi:hypothetical protein
MNAEIHANPNPAYAHSLSLTKPGSTNAIAPSDLSVALSPDGKRFGVIRGAGTPLEILSLSGEILQKIKIPKWRPAGPIEWAVDGKGLFVPSVTLGGASLQYVSLRGEVHVI